MDGLLSAAVLIRDVLSAAQGALGGKSTLIVLDDFYHVPYGDQPDVLAYLHQVVKNLDIWLKICGVRHRLRPFVEGNPPRGMQIGQDAAEISLDITLERFQAAQSFLEQVLSGICAPLDIPIDMLLTQGGRQRLVLGSGGVARDYLHLTQNALRNANERVRIPRDPTIGAVQRTSTRLRRGSRRSNRRILRAMLGRTRTPCVSVYPTSPGSVWTPTAPMSSLWKARTCKSRIGATRSRRSRTCVSCTRSATCRSRRARTVAAVSWASR